jgi:hypothetical protein
MLDNKGHRLSLPSRVTQRLTASEKADSLMAVEEDTASAPVTGGAVLEEEEDLVVE